MSKNILRVSCSCYRALLFVYPAEHRRLYGDAMLQTFRAMLQDASMPKASVILLWIQVLRDTAVNAPIEHFSVMKGKLPMSPQSRFALIFALTFSVLTGYINITATEVLVPMFCLLLFSFVAGLIQPKGAWRWAVIIGLSITLSTFIGLAINFNFPDAPPRYPITLVVLVLPALVAAYIGSLANRVLPTPT